ncbi:diacylglycerol/lipid kinase family protein [Bacteroidota bacterium]
MKYFLIMNPGSKGGKSKKHFNKIFSAFNKAKFDFDFKYTSKLEDAYNFSVEANKETYDVIVAVGGDGTINSVLNGFFDLEGKLISNAKMAVIYTGTSPDFCKSYNIPRKLDEAIQTIINNYSKQIYIGKLLCSSDNNKNFNYSDISEIKSPKLKYFGCCANIGLGATLARKANSGIRKYLGDTLGTFISLIGTLVVYKANDFIVKKDDAQNTISKLYNLSVGRTKFIASGIKISNKINYANQGFYCLTARKINTSNILSSINKVYSGKEFKNTDILSLDYCNTIEIFGNFKNPEIELDGDPIGYLPCKIEISTDKLNLIVKRDIFK